ncbi:MAG: hypothetical protein Harvfovirus31_10 [Harvfovirus sp.]|uniref:Uncharacterized protein n=1 Tax=Harvfovirus sp. TaxID=2487768 RepID=A0A3G5A4H9_9VIRU|nr:MAG: hypothetical protein Harvfovirus31_10 [Harvfovirus sp.]
MTSIPPCICGWKYEGQILRTCNACEVLKVHKDGDKKIHSTCNGCESKHVEVSLCCKCERMPELISREVYISTNIPTVLCQIIGNFMEASLVFGQRKCSESTCNVYSCHEHSVECERCGRCICSLHRNRCKECKTTFCLECFSDHNFYAICGSVGRKCAEKNIKCDICYRKSNHSHIVYRTSYFYRCKTESINVCCNHIGSFHKDKISHTIEHITCHCQADVCPDDLKKCDICSSWEYCHKKINVPFVCNLCERDSDETNVCCWCLEIPNVVKDNHTELCCVCKMSACGEHFKKAWGHCNKCDIEGNRCE